ncbi:MAG: cytochrome c oxidase subunit 4 [Chloroflexota bacterium]
MDTDFQKENEKVAAKQPTGLSYWPICLAAGLVLIAIGIVSNVVVSIFGLLILLTSIAGWAEENRGQKEAEL